MLKVVLLLGALALVVLTGCGPTPNSALSPITFPPKEDIPPVVRIRVPAFVTVDSPLTHELPPEMERVVSVEVHEGETVTEALARLGVPYRVEATAMGAAAPADFVFEGDLREVLDKLCGVFGVFWTVDRGVVSVLAEAVFVYRFPVLSKTRVLVTFQGAGQGEDHLALDRIKKGFFEALAEEASTLFRVNFSGEVLREGGVERNVADLLEALEEETGLEGTSTEAAAKEEKIRTESEESNRKRAKETVEEEGVKVGRKEKAKGGRRQDARGDAAAGLYPEPYGERAESTEVKDVGSRAENLSTSAVDSKEEKRRSEKKAGRKRSAKKASRIENTHRVSYKITGLVEKLKKKVVVLPEAEAVVARLTPDEKILFDRMTRSLVRRKAQRMLLLKAYVVETSEDLSRELQVGLSFKTRQFKNDLHVALQGTVGTITSGAITASGFSGDLESFTLILDNLIAANRARLITAPTLVALDGETAAVKAATDVPYLEPQTISLQTGTSQLTYEIKHISDGVELYVTPLSLSKSVVLAVTLKASRYLGDKEISAGQLGRITVPISAPRLVSTVGRFPLGRVTVLGGVAQDQESYSHASNLNAPYSRSRRLARNRIYLAVYPSLVEFVESER